MKGIERCAECAYYDMQNHECKRGAKDEGEPTARFYADCPLDDAEIVRHERWDDSGRYIFLTGTPAVRCTGCGACLNKKEYVKSIWNFCPICGAKMDGGDNRAAD